MDVIRRRRGSGGHSGSGGLAAKERSSGYSMDERSIFNDERYRHDLGECIMGKRLNDEKEEEEEKKLC